MEVTMLYDISTPLLDLDWRCYINLKKEVEGRKYLHAHWCSSSRQEYEYHTDVTSVMLPCLIEYQVFIAKLSGYIVPIELKSKSGHAQNHTCSDEILAIYHAWVAFCIIFSSAMRFYSLFWPHLSCPHNYSSNKSKWYNFSIQFVISVSSENIRSFHVK